MGIWQQISTALSQVSSSFQYLVSSWPTSVELLSIYKRLRAFEAAARHLSVTLAAGELNVTPGAVSRQIRELEQSLGVLLFERRPRQIRLTEEGEGYFKAMRSAFRMMREATDELLARARSPATLSISCTPTFVGALLFAGGA